MFLGVSIVCDQRGIVYCLGLVWVIFGEFLFVLDFSYFFVLVNIWV